MNTNKTNMESVLVLTIVSAIFIIVLFNGASAQYNYDHVNVTTQVNVTNAGPEVIDVIPTPGAIVLTAGGTKTIFCNSTVRDYNGFADIDIVNATFYHFYNTSGQNDDNNEHYTNTSCVAVANDGQYEANYSCSYDVSYYANNGTWTCNVTANDTFNFNHANSSTTSIAQLFALNVTDVINYGELNVSDYSQNVTATVTNFGNANLNVTVLGYGRVQGDGEGLVCAQGDNISVENQRFYNSLVEWTNKIALAAASQDINVTLLQQVDDGTQVTQNTYWQLFVPPNPFGICNGTVRFTAVSSV